MNTFLIVIITVLPFCLGYYCGYADGRRVYRQFRNQLDAYRLLKEKTDGNVQ